GVSLCFDSEGNLCVQAQSFEEDFIIVEVKSTQSGIEISKSLLPDEEEIEQVRRALVLGIRDYVFKCGFTKVLIGLSGGIDSAIVAALAVEALGPENVHGVSMPSRFSSEHSKTDATDLAIALGISIE